MLAAMATVTSGLLSPNSYGLSSDQTVAKMAAESGGVVESEYKRYRTVPIFSSNVDSSDSEPEEGGGVFQTAMIPKDAIPKRNKRKNFKPRCTNLNYSDSDNNEVLNLSEFSNNNNLKNVRRRKTLATPRKVIVDARQSPMDLSKANDSDSPSDDSYLTENENVADNEDDNSSENDNKIPSSFSIHNLSKPHVPEAA
ncbi:uncharacterized protein LOC116161971, partial [Photinus pyralis]